MSFQPPKLPSTALLSTCLSLAACGGGGAGGEDTNAPAVSSAPPLAAAAGSDLDGAVIRRIGLARFDVFTIPPFAVEFDADSATGLGSGYGYETTFEAPVGDFTKADIAFTELDEPLDDATLARIAAMPTATAHGACYPIGDDGSRSIAALLDALGSPAFAGEVITVSRPAGSWFELTGSEMYGEPEYGMRVTETDFYAGFYPGAEGTVEAGTTIDVPGAAFPAFTAVEVPPLGVLSGVGDDAAGVSWQAGADPSVPVVIDIRFDDYVELVYGGDDGGALTDYDYVDLHTLVEAPADMRCVTRDTGRFAYPEALRSTIERFEAAGRTAADRIAPGSDIGSGTSTEIGTNVDGSLTDEDAIEVTQGRSVGVSRVATRYRIEGDALLIVQSSNGGTL